MTYSKIKMPKSCWFHGSTHDICSMQSKYAWNGTKQSLCLSVLEKFIGWRLNFTRNSTPKIALSSRQFLFRQMSFSNSNFIFCLLFSVQKIISHYCLTLKLRASLQKPTVLWVSEFSQTSMISSRGTQRTILYRDVRIVSNGFLSVLETFLVNLEMP